MPDFYMLQYANKGVNQAVDPAMLTYNHMADAVNLQIDGSTVMCRPGVKIHDLGVEGAFQGAAFYNPAKGISQQTFATDESSIVARIGGKHYKIKPTAKPVGDSTLEVTALDTDATASNDVYHLAFLKQAENYLISQDGNGSTWIWDGEQPPVFSTGYDSEDKEASKLANGASVVAYAHGRVVQVVNNRQVLIGDLIHKSDLTTAANILETTEQTYWASGSFFSPPSELGAVRAVSILPLRDTAHGHGDLMFHCDDGIFSLDLTLYPRTEWVNQAISKHVLLDTGASGFYALTIFDGDQMFLSRHGLQTLRSARAESALVGNPFTPISEPVRSYVDADIRENFKYASVERFVQQNRVFMTTQHIIRDSSNRGGRGILVLNLRPEATNEKAWEGLWTMPIEGVLLNQLVSGLFDSRERMFAFATGLDGKVKLIEFSEDLKDDIAEDGEKVPIKWQVVTRASTMGETAETISVEKAWMTLQNLHGNVSWEVYAKNSSNSWEPWHSGCAEEEVNCGLESKFIPDLQINLGSPPQDVKVGKKFQMLVKLEGCAVLESIKMSASMDKGGNSNITREGTCVILPAETEDTRYDPFEYSK